MSHLFAAKPEFAKAKANIKLLLNPGQSNLHIPKETLNEIYVDPAATGVDFHDGSKLEYRPEQGLNESSATFKKQIAKEIIKNDSMTPLNYGRILAGEHFKLIEKEVENVRRFLKDPTLLGESYYDPKTNVTTNSAGEIRKKRFHISGKNVADLDNMLCGISKVLDKTVFTMRTMTRFMDVHFSMIDRRLATIEYALGLDLNTNLNPTSPMKSLFDQLINEATEVESPLPEVGDELLEMLSNRLPTPNSSIPILTLDDDELEVTKVTDTKKQAKKLDSNEDNSKDQMVKSKPTYNAKGSIDEKFQYIAATVNYDISKIDLKSMSKKDKLELLERMMQSKKRKRSSDESGISLVTSNSSAGSSQSTKNSTKEVEQTHQKPSVKTTANILTRGNLPLFESQPAPPANQSTLTDWLSRLPEPTKKPKHSFSIPKINTSEIAGMEPSTNELNMTEDFAKFESGLINRIANCVDPRSQESTRNESPRASSANRSVVSNEARLREIEEMRKRAKELGYDLNVL